jgi:hypothetical protein
MKRKLVLAFLLCVFSYTINAQEINYESKQTTIKSNPNLEDEFITSVFGDNVVVGSQHHKNLIDLLQNRIEFTKLVKSSDSDKDYPNIAKVPLFNKYNKSITRDSTFDENTFNVLKYDLIFFSNFTKIYRINNTDWVIIIKPIKK